MNNEILRWVSATTTSAELVRGIKGDILTGRLAVGTPLPSRRSLMELSVAQSQIAKAYSELVEASHITPGVGSRPPAVASGEVLPQSVLTAIESMVAAARDLGIGDEDLLAAVSSEMDNRSEWDDDPEAWYEFQREERDRW
jgi:DNA-binding transcriptional regulator YhcF (GntR family)